MYNRLTRRDNEAVPKVSIQSKDSAEQDISRLIARRDIDRRKEAPPVLQKVKTYDIVNAGINHRFSDALGNIIFQCNFGFVYGMLAKSYVSYAKTQYGITVTLQEAERIRDRYFNTYSRLGAWHERRENEVIKYKQTRSIFGRVRHLPQIDSEDFFTRLEAVRQAINSGIQATGSDLGVISLSRITTEIDKRYLYPRQFIHDAIYTYTQLQYVAWGSIALKYYMESNDLYEMFGVDLEVPILADTEIGMSQGTLTEIPDTPFIFLDDIIADDLTYLQDHAEAMEKKGLNLPSQKIPPNHGRIVPRRRRR